MRRTAASFHRRDSAGSSLPSGAALAAMSDSSPRYPTIRTSACAAQPLSLGKQDHEAVDRGGERTRVGATGLREQRDKVRVAHQEVELGFQRGSQALERPPLAAPGVRHVGEGLL